MVKNRIKEYCERRGISQRDLALLVGCTEVSMCRYARQERKPNVYLALRIAKALNADIRNLFLEEG